MKSVEVAFEVQGDWPTPNHCRRTADALDTMMPARYGDILRAYADAEDARFAAHGPVPQCSRCARCGAPIARGASDPHNHAMRVCHPCANELGEEVSP